jgi:hypothetical protein
VLVSPDGTGVDAEGPLHRADRVVLDDHLGQDPVPGAVGGPFPQPLVRGLPRPVALGQIPPRRPGAGLPQDRIDHLPVIAPPPTPATGRRQQGLDPRPRRIGQLTATHHRGSIITDRSDDPQDMP